MPATTIHIPDPLLEAVDARARARGVSRNRFILEALRRVLLEEATWSPGFLDQLRKPLSRGDAAALERLSAEVVARRSSKPSPDLRA